MSRPARLALLLAALLLAGCAGRPEGVLAPVAAAPADASRVDMLVVTTRKPSGDPATLFSGERDIQPSVTEIAVSVPPDRNRRIGQVQWPKRLPPDPQREFATVAVRPIPDPRGANAWLKAHLPANRRVLVFVHGFNNRYEDAVYRFAQIVHDSGADVAPVIFTWPSRGSVFDYNYDKESTNFSRDVLERMLRRLASDPNVGEITVMAHSMGSWLTLESLRQMAIRDGRVAPKIRNVILASPDLDVDVAYEQLLAMGEKRPKITLFVSRDDRALRLSRRISGDIDRLGQIDPTVEPYKSALDRAGITVVDLTGLKGSDALNHGKFAESPEVVRLIGQRLVAGQTITEANIGLGDRIGAVAMGAAQTVGGAASVAVSTPIMIFDPDTRRTYGQQLDRLGRAAGGTVSTVLGD